MRRRGDAIPELAAIKVHGMSREAFLARATLAAGAVYGLGAVTPFVRRALAQGTTGQQATGDVPILNFALLLEHLEAAFYDQARQQVPGLDSDAQALTEELATNEGEHVTALTAVIGTLGGRPTPEPEVDFGNAFASQSSYLKLAQVFEDTGVSAYNGAGPELESKDALAAAGTIVQVEGRHAALIRMMRGEDAAPKAFDDALSIPQVRTRVEPFLVG
jgi:rubrerythrin